MVIRWARTLDLCGWTFFVDRFKTGGWSIGFGKSSWFSEEYKDAANRKPDPEVVLVAVPPEVQSLVGWRPRFHPLIEHDPLTGTTRFSDEQHSGPDTEMVWHWIRGQ